MDAFDRFLVKIVVDVETGCWFFRNGKGHYGSFTFGPGDKVGAHVAAFRLFHGPVSRGDVVRHSCDNPPCVNPSHLEKGTRQDNVDDCVKRGRQVKGEKQHLAVTTAEDVREIRRLYAGGSCTQGHLALLFGISVPTVSQIVRRVTWKHVA